MISGLNGVYRTGYRIEYLVCVLCEDEAPMKTASPWAGPRSLLRESRLRNRETWSRPGPNVFVQRTLSRMPREAVGQSTAGELDDG